MQRLNRLPMRVLLSVCAALLVSALLVGAASAHAHLKSSSPSDGEVLTAQPATVSAVYEEETSLTQTTFDVYYAKDAAATPQRVAQGKVDVNTRTNVSASLPPGLGDGVYTVKWHTVTEDDNGIVDGSFSFTVASGQPASGPTGKLGTEAEAPSTSGSGSTLPTTGNPDSLLPLIGLLGLLVLGGGLVLRRRVAGY